jgi:hypothetical protein
MLPNRVADRRSGLRPQALAGSASSLFLPIATGAVIGMTAVCLLLQPSWSDQSWYLYAASRLLDGAHLYGADIQDTNPPLILWMSTIPVALGRAIGVTSRTGMVLSLILLTWGIICWLLRLNAGPNRVSAKQFAPWLASLLVAVTTIFPNATLQGGLKDVFGQREHIIVLLVLPYLFAVVRRLEARRLPASEAILVGFAAAVGFSLKPQYLFVVAGIEVLIIHRTRDFRHIIRPELVTLALGGLTYCIAVWTFTPDYIKAVIPINVRVYGYWNHLTLLEMIDQGNSLRAIATAVFALIVLRGSGSERLASTLLVAGVAAFVAYLIQGKGWAYHLLPCQMFILLSLGISIIGHFLQWTNRRGIPNQCRMAANCVAVMTSVIVVVLYYPARAEALAKSNLSLTEIELATKEWPVGTAVLVLPGCDGTSLTLAIDRNFVWASRYFYLLLPPESFQSAAGPAALKGHAVETHAGDYVRMLRADYIADFQRWRPKAIFVCDPGDNYPPLFNVIEWLSIDPAFTSIWSHYKFVKQFDRYGVYLSDEN